MARPASSEQTRLVKLRAALDRAVGQGLVDQTLTQAPMCDLLGIKPATLRSWIDDPEVEASGAFVRGGRGVDYVFNPVALIWVLIRYFERLQQQKIDENRRVRELVAGDKLEGAPAEMSVREVREAMSLNLQLLATEREAGDLIKRSDADRRYRELVLALRDALLTSPQKQDPTNQWSPEFRERFDDALADCMVRLRKCGAEALGETTDGPVTKRADAAPERPKGRKKVRKRKPSRA